MRSTLQVAIAGALVAGLLQIFPGQASELSAQAPAQATFWAPKPATLTPWTGVHKPHWKLADVLAAHRGQQNWRDVIVDDELLHAEYISMAPGQRTPTRLYADNPVWWVVQDGQIRFTIDGQEPFVASKGFLVQVPYRVPFSMETVGDVPSLRFEVTVAGASVLYPSSETPTPVAGKEFVRVSFTGRGAYDERNKPFLDFQKDIVNGTTRPGAFVYDVRGFANIIRGRGVPRPPDTNLGHFHLDYGEFWLVLEGQIDYLIEGIPYFVADVGDIVYVPKGRWHRAGASGTGMATRLAMNGYPEGLHNNQARAPE